ncbi:MAG: 30S ribosomal protein S3ae [Candidatus Thermoplasmatota archaeon]
MTKARARTAAKKIKDKWRSKNWYQILAPTLFNTVPVAETLADNPENLVGRVTEISMQDLTNDFRKSHIKLFFKIEKLEGNNAYSTFDGSMLTSDYIRRMIRRRKSRIDGVYDVETRDGAHLVVKPFAITEKRIQHSQKRLIRHVMKETIAREGKAKTFNEFIRDALDGKLGGEIYKYCKVYYPVKRIEIYKTEVKRLPTVIIEETPPIEQKGETQQEKTPEVKQEESMIEKPPEEIVETKEPTPETVTEIPNTQSVHVETAEEPPKENSKKTAKAKKEKKKKSKESE